MANTGRLASVTGVGVIRSAGGQRQVSNLKSLFGFSANTMKWPILRFAGPENTRARTGGRTLFPRTETKSKQSQIPGAI